MLIVREGEEGGRENQRCHLSEITGGVSDGRSGNATLQLPLWLPEFRCCNGFLLSRFLTNVHGFVDDLMAGKGAEAFF